MMVHDCNVFMHDGAPCHREKSVKNFLREKNVDILDWPGNNQDLSLIENLWHAVKNEVANQHPTSMKSLKIIKDNNKNWVDSKNDIRILLQFYR